MKEEDIQKALSDKIEKSLDKHIGKSLSDVSTKMIENEINTILTDIKYATFPGTTINGWPDISYDYTTNITYGGDGSVGSHSAFILSFLQCYPLSLNDEHKPSETVQELIADLAILAFPNPHKVLPHVLPSISKYFTKDGFDVSWMLSINLSDWASYSAIHAGAKLFYLVYNNFDYSDDLMIKNLAYMKLKKPMIAFDEFEGFPEYENVDEETKKIYDQFMLINPFKEPPF